MQNKPNETSSGRTCFAADHALRRRLATCGAVALAVLPGTAAHAQDADGLGWVDRFTAITVTATRSARPVLEVPATVSVITADDMADQMVEDIKDLVRFEPGVSVKRAASRYSAATSGSDARAGNSGFTIRGLDGNRVLIQIDGIRVPDAYSFGGQSAGRGDYVDLGLLKSVEILRGPASALYGSDGLAGAVSFITADPEDLLGRTARIGGRARIGYDGADDQFTENAALAARSGDWSGLVAYTRRDGHELDNKGRIDSRDATRTTPNPQDSASNAVLAKLVWQPGTDTRLRLTIDHVDDRVETHVLTANSATSLDTRARDKTTRDRVGLDWRQSGLGFVDTLQITGYWQKSNNRQFSSEDRATLADRTRLNIFRNRTIGAAADFHSLFATGPLDHHLTWGADASVTRQVGLRDGTVPPAGETFPTRAFPVSDYRLLGAFLADEIGIGDGLLTLYPVLRFDHFSIDAKADPAIPTLTAIDRNGSRVSPKLGAVLKLRDDIRLFANYARGFRAPSPTQINQFFENPLQRYRTIANGALKPERNETIEGGLRLNNESLSLNLTGFTGTYHDFISLEGVGVDPTDGFLLFQNVNLGKVRISGVEAQFKARSRTGLTADVALSYARGTVNPGSATEAGLLSIDPAKLVVGVGYQDPAHRFGGRLIMTHSEGKSLGGTRLGGAVSGCSATLECLRPNAFTILDATAFLRIGEHLTLRAGIFNLLDTRYAWWSDVRPLAATTNVAGTGNLDILDSYTQPGRNVSVSLTARF